MQQWVVGVLSMGFAMIVWVSDPPAVRAQGIAEEWCRRRFTEVVAGCREKKLPGPKPCEFTQVLAEELCPVHDLRVRSYFVLFGPHIDGIPDTVLVDAIFEDGTGVTTTVIIYHDTTVWDYHEISQSILAGIRQHQPTPVPRGQRI